MKLAFIKKAVVAAGFFVAASSSYASLIYVSDEQYQGTGLGSVNTILTIQNTGTETGSVSLGVGVIAGADVITGDAKTGASQTQTRSFAELGLTDAASLRVIFNAVEPSGNSINLDNLVLTLYTAAGGTLFTSNALGPFTPVFFESSFTGTGNAGFVFKLDSVQAAAAQSAFTGSFGTNRVGLSATASLAAGGNETFFVANAGDLIKPPAEVPEPGTVALLGLGLLGAVVARRKALKK